MNTNDIILTHGRTPNVQGWDWAAARVDSPQGSPIGHGDSPLDALSDLLSEEMDAEIDSIFDAREPQ